MLAAPVALDDVLVIAPAQADTVQRAAFNLLVDEAYKRTGRRWLVRFGITKRNPARVNLVAAREDEIADLLPPALRVRLEACDALKRDEGFSIRSLTDGKRRWIIVSGHDDRGMLFGLGRLLRKTDWSGGHGRLDAPTACVAPDLAVRGHQLGYRAKSLVRSDHVAAILEGLSDGTIDAIASDHAPHHADEKDLEFDQAPFGIIGLETTIGLAFERLVRPGVISLDRLVELCATSPARVLSLHDRGTFKAGARADVTILDPQCAWRYDVSQSKSKSRNTPFDGYEFVGAAIATMVNGRVVYLRRDYTNLHEVVVAPRTIAAG